MNLLERLKADPAFHPPSLKAELDWEGLLDPMKYVGRSVEQTERFIQGRWWSRCASSTGRRSPSSGRAGRRCEIPSRHRSSPRRDANALYLDTAVYGGSIVISDAIKSRLGAFPVQAVAMRLASGATYDVPHPELVSLSPGGRHLILWIDDNRYVDIDVLLVESIEQASGRGRRGRRDAPLRRRRRCGFGPRPQPEGAMRTAKNSSPASR